MGNQNLIEKTYWFDYFIETEISKCYKMVSCPHGKCIIINIMNFDGHALITRWRSRKNTFWKALLHCWYQVWSYFIPNVGWSLWDCCSRPQGIWRSFFIVMSHKSYGVTIFIGDVEDQFSGLLSAYKLSSVQLSCTSPRCWKKKVIYTSLAGNTSMQLFRIAVMRTKTIRTKKYNILH